MEWEAKEHERAAAAGKGGASGMGDEGEGDAAAGARFVAYVPLPDQKEIEQKVLQKKKADLMAKYASDALQSAQDEAKSLLNVRH